MAMADMLNPVYPPLIRPKRGMKAMTPHQEALQLANSLPLWIFCILVISLIFVQTIGFLLLGRKHMHEVNITKMDISRSVKSGLISTFGPALSIFVVGMGLISQIGAPITISRLSVIGNATYEASAAEMAAVAMNTSINFDSYSMTAFAASVWVMNLGGICMVLPTLIFLKPLSKLTDTARKTTWAGMVISLSASIASFGYFSIDYVMKDMPNLVAVATGFFGMLLLQYISNRFKINWIKEWAPAITIILAIILIAIFFKGR